MNLYALRLQLNQLLKLLFHTKIADRAVITFIKIWKYFGSSDFDTIFRRAFINLTWLDLIKGEMCFFQTGYNVKKMSDMEVQ
uniref:Uncharacterized protein n=1 Tax=Glossina austeni TaxID=7395 RepID=A0A1A9UZB0_GLOAU